MLKSTSQLKRAAPETVLAGLLDASNMTSVETAKRLIGEAKDYGLDLRSYLRLAIDPRLAANDNQAKYLASPNEFMNGYEAALSFLNLPVRDDIDGGVMLQAAADTFQTFPGTRALFPPVIDDVVRWKYKQTNYETTDGMVGNKRSMVGNELISTVVNDTSVDYEQAVGAVAEGGRIPIHTIRTSEKSVKMWKFGNGYKTTYEFNRRASIDLLTPYAVRTQKQIERSKVAVALNMLINGDGVSAAATTTSASSLNSTTNGVGTATAGKLDYKHLAAWLVARAKAGYPVDTVMGNWDMYLQWLFLFAIPTTNGASRTDAENLAASGFQISGVPILTGEVQFKLASGAPTGQLVGFSRDDTLEELTEAGSLITESERSIETQEVTYVRTETSGFRVIFDGTRDVFDTTS